MEPVPPLVAPATSPLTGPITGIVIPVREAETLVRSRMLQVPPELRPVGSGIGAHVTLLAPFRPEPEINDDVLAHLTGFFAELAPFAFELTEIAQFPDGITYLAPDPAAPFRRLTLELHREFPEFPPYGGAFDDVVPHLTVPLGPGETTTGLRTALEPSLPIRCYAREALLVHAHQEGTHVIATLPFGNAAA